MFLRRKSMKKSLIIASVFIMSGSAFAKTECTNEPKDKWQDQAKFQQSLKDQGYKINRFQVTDGNCYEIYGFSKDKKKVEIYFNPVDGKIVKEEIH